MSHWRVTASAISLLLATLLSTAAAAAALPGLLTGLSGKQFRVKPPVVVYTGDGSGVLGGFDGSGRRGHFGHLHWSAWDQTHAVGSGAVWLDNCTPDCARGRFLSYAVAVRASSPRNGHFTRLRLRYRYKGRVIIDVRTIHQNGASFTY